MRANGSGALWGATLVLEAPQEGRPYLLLLYMARKAESPSSSSALSIYPTKRLVNLPQKRIPSKLTDSRIRGLGGAQGTLFPDRMTKEGRGAMMADLQRLEDDFLRSHPGDSIQRYQ